MLKSEDIETKKYGIKKAPPANTRGAFYLLHFQH